MNILLLGSGGREHAFAWKISKSKLCKKLFVAPGNAGTQNIAENINLNINDFNEIKDFVIKNNIELVIVGPEEPLVRGIVDFFNKDLKLTNVKIFGPSKKGAQLEGSKDFSKNFMFRNNIPCGKSKTFNKKTINKAFKFLETMKAPYVLKADGLAAGKGVMTLNILEQNYNKIPYVVDKNPNIQGKFIPITGNKIISPNDLKKIKVENIYVLNSLYLDEIISECRGLDVHANISPLFD